MDHNQQGGPRRGHFHRGRRGADRRGHERRQTPPDQTPARGGEHVDVEQIMREIRARIAQRHGIELSNQQVQELAARRLEAILDPRTVNPALLEQLRKSAGAAAVDPMSAPEPEPSFTFEESTLFESHRGLLRFIRTLLNPILKLFFNPNPLIAALNTQSKLNAAATARERERDRRQAEWNALHYELLQRVVTETARVSLELQQLSLRVESLAGKVDFNERRVRGIEGAQATQTAPRLPARAQDVQPVAAVPVTGIPRAAAAASEQAAGAGPPQQQADGQRRRRRRRRGRRGAGSAPDDAALNDAMTTSESAEAANGDADIADENAAEDELDDVEAESRVPAHAAPSEAGAELSSDASVPAVDVPAAVQTDASAPTVTQERPAAASGGDSLPTTAQDDADGPARTDG